MIKLSVFALFPGVSLCRQHRGPHTHLSRAGDTSLIGWWSLLRAPVLVQRMLALHHLPPQVPISWDFFDSATSLRGLLILILSGDNTFLSIFPTARPIFFGMHLEKTIKVSNTLGELSVEILVTLYLRRAGIQGHKRLGGALDPIICVPRKRRATIKEGF